jgi:ATP-dependent protease ClpP protease subunit
MEINWGINNNTKRKNPDESDKKIKKHKKEIENKTFSADCDNSDDESVSNSSSTIFSHDNHVYFYTHVDNNSMLSLQKEVRNTIKRLLDKQRTAESVGLVVTMPSIKLHINSPGGGIFACFSFIDFMTQMKKKNNWLKFTSIVEGRAASAGTLISVVCDRREITEYGFMLIHQLSSATWGKYYDIKDDVENLDSLMDKIRTIYRTHTNVPFNELEEILKHDLYWDSKKCLEYGLVDVIIE